MATVASKVPFLHLCKVCEKISKKDGKDNKKAILRQFIQQWREFHSNLHASDSNSTDSFYPAMRLLLPQLERERTAYGIKEVTLARLYIEILCLNKESADAQKLLNYRSPKAAKSEAGDFANVAYFVLKNRCPGQGCLTVETVNNHLDNIAIYHASKDKGKVKENLLHLLHNTSALEQKWLIRMVLKDMKMGISEQSILETFHPDSKDLYDVTNSLAKVCSQLKDPSVRLHEIEISLFSPFRPMLAAQSSPDRVEKQMKGQPFVIETKFDGERMQLHRKGNEFKYFSRSGNEYTHSFGGSPLEGNLTKFIAGCFNSQVKTVILDGEMVGYNTDLNCIGSKGENFDVKSLQADDTYQPCFCVFDVLFYNGKVLSNLPLCERYTYLDKLFTPCEGKLMYADKKKAQTKQEVVDSLNQAIDRREEGVVLKSLDSTYCPNARKGGWLKVKPEYVAGLMDELDLLILGGYFGEGRRSKKISHFLLGVAVPPDARGSKPGCFYSLTKVGSGYSQQELAELLMKLKDHWQPYDKRNPPSSIVLAQGHKEKPDLWIEPCHSYILQVKATEIIASDNFKTGCSLRFPRVDKVRTDKAWHDCMTTAELAEMQKLAAGKLASRHAGSSDKGESRPSPKKLRAAREGEKLRVIAPHFQPANTADIRPISEILAGKELCIVTGFETHTKQNLEQLAAQYGATLVQNPGPSTYCVLADKVNIRVANIISTKQYDVVKTNWLLQCIEQKQFIPWTPFDMWHTSECTENKFMEKFDRYGDSYTKDATVDSLKHVFDNVTKEEWQAVHLTNRVIAELEFDCFPNSPPYGLFRLCRVYVDNKASADLADAFPCHPLNVVERQLRMYGATVVPCLDQSVTHVVVHSSDEVHSESFVDKNRERESGKFHLVTERWVTDCVAKGCLNLPYSFYGNDLFYILNKMPFENLSCS